MTNILDQVARSARRARYSRFQPATAEDFFGLRLASKLNDSSAALHYVQLTGQHSEDQLLVAYHRARAQGNDVSLARRFHVELERLHQRNGNQPLNDRLAAIRVERRAVSVAILSGQHLEYTQPRQLSSVPEKAIATTVSFLIKIWEKFSFQSAAFETIPNGHEVLRARLQKAAIQALSQQSVSIWEVSKPDLFAAFGYPALESRKELREIAANIYPVLDEEPGQPWTHDAAALGLYVQVERLFNNIN